MRSLPSAGITRLPRYLRTSPPPCRPDLTLAGCRLTCAAPPAGLPVLRPSPSSMRAVANTPAETVGARVARLPDRWQPSPCGRRVGFRITGFEACSAFARATARVVAEPPNGRPFGVGVLQPMSSPPSSAPTATGWSDSCRAGFAPAERRRLSRRTSTVSKCGGPTMPRRSEMVASLVSNSDPHYLKVKKTAACWRINQILKPGFIYPCYVNIRTCRVARRKRKSYA